MKKKELFTIIAILTFVAGIGLFIALSGIKANNNRYVRIEVNPKVEFITDMQNNVISYLPINDEAKILLCDEDFIGMKVYNASLKFVDLCAQANYIDVNGKDNAVRITAVGGVTQSLESRIYSKINNYFKNSEIKAVIVESDNDIDLISEAHKRNITSSNKLMLIDAILEKDSNAKEEELNKLSETKLIDKLIEIHKNTNYSPNSFTAEQIANKTKLIDFNRENYETHMNRITNESLSEFSEEYDKFKLKYEDDYEENFNEQYRLWRNSIWEHLFIKSLWKDGINKV